MAHPVTHFEVNALDAAKLQRFYGDLFGWRIDSNNPMQYGVIDTGNKGHGINGGVGATTQGRSWVTFYVETPDLALTLAKAEQLGGRMVQPPTDVPGVSFAIFSDPEGNLIGLAKSEEHAAPPKPRRATRATTAKKRTARRTASKTAKRPTARTRAKSRPARPRRRR